MPSFGVVDPSELGRCVLSAGFRNMPFICDSNRSGLDVDLRRACVFSLDFGEAYKSVGRGAGFGFIMGGFMSRDTPCDGTGSDG